MPVRSDLLDDIRTCAAQRGLNLLGLVDAVRFDHGQPCDAQLVPRLPGCGTLVVLASGGRGTAGSVTRCAPFEVAARLQAHGIRLRVVEAGVEPRVRFACLGEAAGFGIVSPVSGLLVHPVYGPWLRLRAVLLLEGKPFGEIVDPGLGERFQPCVACERPCATACPTSALDGLGHHDLRACADHRHRGGCTDGCGVRIACPVGAEHRDSALGGASGHVMPLPALRRWFGFGVWQFVPRLLRTGRARS